MVGYRRGYFNGPDGIGAIRNSGSIQNRSLSQENAVIPAKAGIHFLALAKNFFCQSGT
jgi:hypothetical protein